ncbi:hypothetical protein Golob_027620, partial [Gossypium lobatum]|nr:hypothetical protein [Gossypium lobatum]
GFLGKVEDNAVVQIWSEKDNKKKVIVCRRGICQNYGISLGLV